MHKPFNALKQPNNLKNQPEIQKFSQGHIYFFIQF